MGSNQLPTVQSQNTLLSSMISYHPLFEKSTKTKYSTKELSSYSNFNKINYITRKRQVRNYTTNRGRSQENALTTSR